MTSPRRRIQTPEEIERKGLVPGKTQMDRVFELLIHSDDSLKEIAFRIGVTVGAVKVYTCRLYGEHHAAHGRTTLMLREIQRLNVLVNTYREANERGVTIGETG